MTTFERNEVSCHHCFADRSLQELIKEEGKRGQCPWCKRRNVYLIKLEQLGEKFRDSAAVYSEVEGQEGWEHGEYIGTRLQYDCRLFDEKIENMGLENDLARAILYSGIDPKEYIDYPDYNGFFVRDESYLEEEWSALAEQALTGSPPPSFEQDDPWPRELEIAFEDFAVWYDEGTDFYRARIYEDRDRTERFSFDELYAPPPQDCRAGRANLAGSPVLYLGSSRSTALAEVRVWKGAAVAVAKHRLKHRVLLVDLRKPRPIMSLFAMHHPRWQMQVTALLHRLSEDLARPLMAHEEKLMYRPTQYLASLIKEVVYSDIPIYQGLIYPSRMASGFNIVLFNPGDDTKVIERTDFRIKSVAFFPKELQEYEDIYGESPYDGYYPKRA